MPAPIELPGKRARPRPCATSAAIWLRSGRIPSYTAVAIAATEAEISEGRRHPRAHRPSPRAARRRGDSVDAGRARQQKRGAQKPPITHSLKLDAACLDALPPADWAAEDQATVARRNALRRRGPVGPLSRYGQALGRHCSS